MKAFFRKNILAIFSFLVLIVWLTINVFQYIDQHNVQVRMYNQYKEKYQELCQTDKTFCNMKKPEYPDTMTVFYQIMFHESLYNLQVFAPIFIFIPCIWSFHKKMKSGYYKNELTRMSYKKFIQNSFKEVFKNTWILLGFVIVLFMISYILSGNFDYEATKLAYGEYLSTFDWNYIEIWPIFMVVYLIVIWLHSVFYVNLALIFSKKNSNLFIVIILSYLSFMGIEFILTLIGAFFARILDIHYVTEKLNLFNIWGYKQSFPLPFVILYALALVCITGIIVYFLYRNKEEVILVNEERT